MKETKRPRDQEKEEEEEGKKDSESERRMADGTQEDKGHREDVFFMYHLHEIVADGRWARGPAARYAGVRVACLLHSINWRVN